MRAGALHREERAWRRTWKLLGAILAAGHPQALGDKKPGTELRACQESGLNLEDDEAIARFS